MFDVQIAHSVQEVPQAVWDRLSGDRPFASHRWYHYGETVLSNNVPVYVILSLQGEPVARATFWTRWHEPLPIRSRVVRWLAEATLRRWPLLTCQSPLLEAPGLVLPDDPVLRQQALDTIHRIACEQAQRYSASFLVYDHLERSDARCVASFEGFAATEVQGPGTILSVHWPDYESYLDSLGRSTRTQLRRNRRRAARMGIEVVHHSPMRRLAGPIVDDAVAQIWNVERRHRSASTPWARRMLEYAHMVDSTWLQAEIDGRMVGSFLVLGDGGVRKMTLMGRLEEVQYAYFSLIYAAVRCAIEEGVRVLWGGSGVYDMKQRLGFQLAGNNHAAFSGMGPLARMLGRAIAGLENGGQGD